MRNCIHLVDDVRPGGVQTNLNAMQKSATAMKLAMRTLRVTPNKPLSVRHLRAEIIVVHFSLAWSKLPFLALLALLNPKAQLILQEHHYSPEHFRMTPEAARRFKKLYKISATLFDKIVAVSEAQAHWYMALGSKPEAVIPPMADLQALLQIPYKPRGNRLVIGISGRLNQIKGIDVALQLITTNTTSKTDFLFAGYGELASEVADAAEAYSNVTSLGEYENPEEYLRQADIILIPSRLDTYGLTALEARAAGKPIIVARTCGLTNQADGCGFVFEQGDTDALTKIIARLVDSACLRDLSSNARHSAAQHNLLATQRWTQVFEGA